MTLPLEPGPNTLDAVESSALREFDGVLFFGGVDWWYHNRGHYDLQMAREMSKMVPVLYINSIGMRVPKLVEGGMFVRRVKRKLRSLARGLTRVNDRFCVFSPGVLPGGRLGAMTRRLLPAQAMWAARRAGMRRPLVWVACPPASEAALALVGKVGRGLVYQRTDRFEEYRGVDRGAIIGNDRLLKREADITLFCSSLLFEQESGDCRGGAGAVFVDHGVDYSAFEQAGEPRAVPSDVADLKKPLVGFVGGIDEQTFDPGLFNDVARRLADVNFVLVGACSLEPDWCNLGNVRQLGKRPYEQVASYMAACDVLIMPWNRSEWIRACNPVKHKEYLAVGRPVVTTWFEELRRYEGLVRVARDAESFAGAIRAALTEAHDAVPGRTRVRAQTWTNKCGEVLAALRERGVISKHGRDVAS
ncbi:MAG: glycosyltransferase [Phycisphaerales bacterium]